MVSPFLYLFNPFPLFPLYSFPLPLLHSFSFPYLFIPSPFPFYSNLDSPLALFVHFPFSLFSRYILPSFHLNSPSPVYPSHFLLCFLSTPSHSPSSSSSSYHFPSFLLFVHPFPLISRSSLFTFLRPHFLTSLPTPHIIFISYHTAQCASKSWLWACVTDHVYLDYWKISINHTPLSSTL